MDFSLCICLISAFFLPFTSGAVSFGSFPSSTEVTVGEDAHLIWIYSVDNKGTEFAANSPTWDVYNSSTGTWIQIASEYKFDTPPWKWSITTASCPPSLRERLTKLNGSLATLVIERVEKADGGRYRCNLQRTGGSSLDEEVRLIVLDPPTTAAPIATTIASISFSPTLTQTPYPTSIPVSTTLPPTEPPTKVTKDWVAVVVGVVLGILLVVFLVFLLYYLCCPQRLENCCPRCFECFEKCCPCCSKNHGNVSGDDQGKLPEPGGELPTKPREEDIPMREKQNLRD